MHDDLIIRPLTTDDQRAALAVINTAAEWYREFLPPDELQGPEMTEDGWQTEARRMTWYGSFDGDALVGVMGLEYVKNAALFRHAYVLSDYQRQGVASMLHRYLEDQVRDVERIIVGTYAANYKARRALEKGGYQLSTDSEDVLRTHYDIPDHRIASSVTYEKAHGGRA